MKTYTFELKIVEGNDEFWESITDRSGCDEVHEAVLAALEANGFVVTEDEHLKLVAYAS